MNLVAKEFLASRDDEQGVLILSRFTGAARELNDALIVNPYDIDQIAARTREALIMPDELRRDRMRALRHRVHPNNLESWSSSFLECLDEASRTRQAVAAA